VIQDRPTPANEQEQRERAANRPAGGRLEESNGPPRCGHRAVSMRSSVERGGVWKVCSGAGEARSTRGLRALPPSAVAVGPPRTHFTTM